MKILEKAKKSAAFRSGGVYKFLLNGFRVFQPFNKPELPLVLLTMCGEKHLPLLQQCLYSLCISWNELPKLCLVSDGTISLEKLAKSVTWYPCQKKVLHWRDCVTYHRELKREHLAQFAENNVIGRKLAAIVYAGEQNLTLWCDTDILWFQQLPEATSAFNSSEDLILKVSKDFQPAYDNRLIDFDLQHLKNPPFVNTGLVLIRGSLMKVCKISDLLELASKKSNHFTEQTILAEAVCQTSSSYWSIEQIVCFVDDNLSLAPTYIERNWIARHYVGPVRHLFWRDALALRLKVKARRSTSCTKGVS